MKFCNYLIMLVCIAKEMFVKQFLVEALVPYVKYYVQLILICKLLVHISCGGYSVAVSHR